MEVEAAIFNTMGTDPSGGADGEATGQSGDPVRGDAVEIEVSDDDGVGVGGGSVAVTRGRGATLYGGARAYFRARKEREQPSTLQH